MKAILILMWSILSGIYVYLGDYGALRFSIGAISGVIVLSLCDYLLKKLKKRVDIR